MTTIKKCLFGHVTERTALLLAMAHFVLSGHGDAVAEASGRPSAREPSTSIGLPAEGSLAPFLREAAFETQILFDGGKRVREPYLAVSVDGTVLAMQNYDGRLRRSEDGGRTWGEIIEVPFGFGDTSFIVDEVGGDILTVRMWEGEDRLWRSRDQGKTWEEEAIVLKPNEVMKWLERSGLKLRSSREGGKSSKAEYYLHGNASESGVTLRHGAKRGRLIVTATFRPHAEEHPSDRDPVDAIYSCAIYSDDRGKTWQVSGLFPDGYTEEATLAELHDGRVYYNSRSHRGFYDKDMQKELPPEANLRRVAWSNDAGESWEGLEICGTLPDGGGYDRGYGMKAGLVRLPVKGRDILLYSNADTAGGERENMTVWGSFDGGKTWPVKRLVFEGPGAYSSLATGRPGTVGEGQVYLLFEGVESHAYEGMQIARFNLSWLLGGESTGDGNLPGWLSR